MGYLLSLSGAVLISVFALASLALWIRLLVLNSSRLRSHLLRPVHVVRIEEGALLTTFATMFAVLLIGNVLMDVPHSPVVFLRGLTFGVVVLILLWTILWGMTFWLRMQARQPSYVYFLPRDAQSVRRQHCRYGMVLLASMYPTVFVNRDVLDTFSRATEVSSRLELAPRWKREHWELTNDFAVYCNVASEGYQCGYLGLLSACEEASDQLETVRVMLKEWPETPESQQAMEHWVTQLMGPEPQADESGGAA